MTNGVPTAVAHLELSATTVPIAVKLDRLIESKDYPEFERELPTAQLNRNDRMYFEGLLAHYLNEPKRALVLLERVLPGLSTSNRRRAAFALEAIAEDDFMIGRYSDATARYEELLHQYSSLLDNSEHRMAQDNHDTFALLAGAAPQSIFGGRSFTVPTRTDPLGDVEVPLAIGRNSEWWIFDTGANISNVTVSTAKRLGLKISKERAQTQGGATGVEVPLSTAIIPELRFGRALIRNVVVLVMDDKELNVDLGPKRQYQIQGILGFPVLAALGSFTFKGDMMQIGPTDTSSVGQGHLYVDELTPLIAADSFGATLLFQFDTGNAVADLTARYLNRFPQQFVGLKKDKAEFSGAGGASAVPIYHLPALELAVGSETVRLTNVTLFAGDRGEFLDKLYGNLGQGLLRQFRSYTINFAKMRLLLKEPTQQ
jgi:predicted aspartyl protease